MSHTARRTRPGKPFDELWRELVALPDDLVGEIVAGEIVASPRPDPPHVRSQSNLQTLLGGPFGFGLGGPGGWVLVTEPRVRFGDEVRVPDLAGWRRERYAEPEHGPYEVVPDWICEVLSVSTAAIDRAEKLPLYARSGVGHVWLVDPAAKTLEVLRRQGDLWLVLGVYAGEARVRAEPFESFELELGLLWRV